MNLVLFDIDGTLLRTEGAGRAAMEDAMRALYGRGDAFEGVSFAGGVDPALVGGALERVGVQPTPTEIGRVRTAYLRALRRRIAATVAAGKATICPGSRELIRDLAPLARVGLMTGNWLRGARIKLTATGLWEPFAGGPGAYGDDADQRDLLMPYAVRRARRLGPAPTRILLIGDTPSDVSAARAGHRLLGPGGPEVVAVAVCTGFASRESLEQSAPDLLLENLAVGRDAVLGALQAQG